MSKGESGGNNNTTFLRINKDGLLYQTAKTATEGFNEVALKDGGVAYHKTYNWVKGGLKAVRKFQSNYSGIPVDMIAIIFLDEFGEEDFISFPLLTTRGGLNDYAISLACIIENLHKGEEYVMSCDKRTEAREGKTYLKNRRFYFAYPNSTEENNLVRLAQIFGDTGTIPANEKEEGIGGKVVYNTKKRDAYLYNIITKEMDRINETEVDAQPNSEATAKTTSVQNTPMSTSQSTSEGAGDDDLPF
jgi:hypothetical protein